MTEAIPGVAIFVAKPGHEAEVERLLKTLVTPSRGEAGATYYNLHRDRENLRRFVFTEEWESQAALDAHVASKHVAEVFKVLQVMRESSQIFELTVLEP
ncbi:putative quinol monooxygenase [uncultured Agrobacterium sp.]|uniref:putative quinol monooxygenase n=1 Tax=uncultured Agrobacterium sp. TaxID=157277 RepID=UPI0025E20026|nr:putative quinol monooxygenase [uncultured Agrobacterium sp.]